MHVYNTYAHSDRYTVIYVCVTYRHMYVCVYIYIYTHVFLSHLLSAVDALASRSIALKHNHTSYNNTLS